MQLVLVAIVIAWRGSVTYWLGRPKDARCERGRAEAAATSPS
jgi:hypothetical protein